MKKIKNVIARNEMTKQSHGIAAPSARNDNSPYKIIIISILITTIFFLLYSWHLPQSYIFDNDFARDLNDILKITQGHITLIGPKSSFGGIYNGPFYYYLFTPIFILSHLNLNAILYSNAFLFAAAIGLTYYWCRSKFDHLPSFLMSSGIGLLPFYILAARAPGNAFSSLSFLLVLIMLVTFKKKFNPLMLIGLGFLGGFIVNFHMANLIPIIFLFIFLFIILESKISILYTFCGFGITFIPLALFEIKHQFVMFKNTFIDKSYKLFINDQNVGNGQRKTFFDNLIFIFNQIKTFAVIHPFVTVVGGLALILKNKYDLRFRILFIVSIVNFVILLVILRFQYAPYYVFPSILLLYVSVILLLYRYTWLLALIVVIELSFFPKYLYQPSHRTAKVFEDRIEKIVGTNVLPEKSHFNIIQIRPETAITPLGYEYRYFFKRAGYNPDLETEYNMSNTLLVFSEVPTFTLDQLHSWEAEQFGKQYFKKAKKVKLKDVDVYIIKK